MKLTTLTVIAGLFLAAGTASLCAQTNDVQGQLSSKDFKFAREAMRGGAVEVTLGQIAEQNSQDKGVRSFGTLMRHDHRDGNQKLAQVLGTKGASVSDAGGWLQTREINHLQSLKGAEFDRAYMKEMIKDHEKTIKLFQKEVDKGDDADIKNFASTTLPTLREHLRMAQDTEAKLGTVAANSH